jgi:hypothetical protein
MSFASFPDNVASLDRLSITPLFIVNALPATFETRFNAEDAPVFVTVRPVFMFVILTLPLLHLKP